MENEFRKYKDLFDSIEAGIVYQNDQGKIIEANAAAECILGYSKKDLLKLTSNSKEWKAIKEDGSPFPWNEHPSMVGLQTGKKVSNVIMGIFNNIRKEIRWINISSAPEFRTGEKKPYQIITTFFDVTEQKQLNDQLQQFKIAVEFSTDAVGMATPEGKHYFQNKAFTELFGDIGDDPPATLYAEEKSGREIFRIIKAGSEWNGEVKMYSRDHSLLDINLRAYSIKDIHGKVTGLVGVHTDITSQKKAELELRESEQRYKALIEDQTELISRYLPDTTLTFVNDAYCRFFGKNREDFIGKSHMHMIAPEYREQVLKETQTLAENKGSVVGEYINYRYDGKECWIQWSVKCITDNAEKVVELQAVGRDLTEFKKATEALKESEKKFRSMIEHSSDAITLIDKNGKIIYESPTVKKLTGYEVADRIGKNTYETVFKEDRNKIKELLTKLIQGKENFVKSVIRAIRKDGSHWWVEGTAVNRLNDPNIGAIVINFHDITLQKMAEDRLRLTQFGIDHAQIAVMQLNDDGNIYYANEEACRSLGYTLEEMMKLNVTDFNPTFNPKKWKEHRKLTFQEGVRNIETLHKRKNGTVFPVETTINTIEYEGKKHTFSFTRDITERKQAVEELKKAKKKAEESDRLKTAFLANMSHEIRTPMNGILGFADLLKNSDITEDEQVKYINIIEKSGQRMLDIINDLIDISKIEAGQVEISITPVSINKILDTLYEFFLPEARKKQLMLTLTKELTEEESVIETDERKLSQVISNLIKNAIKYTPSGSIRMGYYVKDNYVIFYIQDTGIGIKSENQKKIFDRFTQGEDDVFHFSEGSGLGLSISKAFIEMLNGKIWLESEPDKGSTFYFSLPYRNANLTLTSNEPKPDRMNENKLRPDLTILIAEDDDTSYMYLEEILNRQNIKILRAINGDEAIKLATTRPEIGIVLMDIKMPVINGFDATRIIKKQRPKLPVIAQTAYALANDNARAMEAGCDDYISKPINKNLLFEKILKLVI